MNIVDPPLAIEEFLDNLSYSSNSELMRHFQDGNLQKEVSNLLEGLGQDLDATLNMKFLGSGAMAVVFRLSNKRVLKITMSVDDAKANAKIIGKRYKHLLKVYDVWQLNKEIYAIVAEKLVPLPRDKARVWDEAIRIFKDVDTWNPAESISPRFIRHLDSVKDSLPESPKKDAIMEVFPTLKGLSEDLDKAGILHWNDYRSDNVMLRGHDIVATDFGWSDVTGTPTIKKLGSMRQQTLVKIAIKLIESGYKKEAIALLNTDSPTRI